MLTDVNIEEMITNGHPTDYLNAHHGMKIEVNLR